MSRDRVEIRADSVLRRQLVHLMPGPEESKRAELAPEVADVMLARIVWSRLVEPGDAVAGTLVATLGPGPAANLLASGVSGQELCAALRARGEDQITGRQATAAIQRWLPRLDRSAVVADVARARERNIQIVVPEAEQWSPRLDDLGMHAPVLLWVRGDPAILSSASLAVVGARACTGYGTHVTAELTADACAAGVAIVSGAAYGIDAVAHRAALALQAPTIAVLAGGLDRPYPSAHGPLLTQIGSTGAVCSEMAPGSAPTRWRFLQRNRIIAALSQATLVTEAGSRSGSLNTAGHTAELGRPLGAVPGPITSAASVGCHRLIREYGASLVANGAELRELLGMSDVQRNSGVDGTGPALEGEGSSTEREPVLHRRVIDALPLRGGRSADEIARLSGIAFDDARGALAELELLGKVRRRETPGAAEEHWALQRGQ